jgi:hypothetical protein
MSWLMTVSYKLPALLGYKLMCVLCDVSWSEAGIKQLQPHNTQVSFLFSKYNWVCDTVRK